LLYFGKLLGELYLLQVYVTVFVLDTAAARLLPRPSLGAFGRALFIVSICMKRLCFSKHCVFFWFHKLESFWFHKLEKKTGKNSKKVLLSLNTAAGCLRRFWSCLVRILVRLVYLLLIIFSKHHIF